MSRAGKVHYRRPRGGLISATWDTSQPNARVRGLVLTTAHDDRNARVEA